jgi:8-oxo-dGTP pyrophosphatase MutT (NUDIX family)
MKTTYGGVVISPQGKVHLRKPSGTPGLTLWTFAKGKPEPGETMETTALREVREETGIEARIVKKIPGEFSGNESLSEFFLMTPLHDHGVFDGETEAVVWATRTEAEELISLTAKDRRRTRDLELLDQAYALFYCLPTPTR